MSDAKTEHKAKKILVLDDENELRSMLQRYLRDQGFDVRTAENGARLDRLLQREPFDLLVLDLMMEPEDGLSVCRRLRAANFTLPILMLTARGDPVDRVIGLETGADDYLAKPFLPQELVARIKAIFRRQALQQGETPAGSGAVCFGPYRLDITRQTLYREDQLLALNSAEMNLLIALATTPNRPVSRENLLSRARGREYAALDRSVDVQMLRLRQQLEAQPSEPRWLKTVWGMGYMLIVDSET
ncbi:Transcriptional regulatory protein ompR [Pantoea sp. AS-PWVM4]|uniref:DNA-binding dual transcriptional regulator OmpR n=1 Tax=Pantoea phytobeneficialis TaxID=2052056 RepID=A0AAP9HB55_9GAMM|nr:MULTISPECIES: response regulator [Pantoea]ERK16349.1 Transcriptional regulatory protein ompR [Pantoea sp. AS-PWVM4]MDO6409923.1 response regulator [Pantoea phytobeneficialis]QGR09797.1 DNA-binding response regulator [Pantoea phytobeneficialis]